MRKSSCRCVAKKSEIGVAKIITRSYEVIVCDYHREEHRLLNIQAEREIGVLSRNDIVKFVNLDNNTIYL